MLHQKKHTAGHDVTVLPCCNLWLLHCHKRSGTEASRRGKNCKSECRPDMIRVIENHRFLIFCWTLKEQNRGNAQGKRKFSILSHTPASRNECPCCKHFLTTPANTSILSLSLKNQNFKFVSLTGRRVNRLPSLSAVNNSLQFRLSAPSSWPNEDLPCEQLFKTPVGWLLHGIDQYIGDFMGSSWIIIIHEGGIPTNYVEETVQRV